MPSSPISWRAWARTPGASIVEPDRRSRHRARHRACDARAMPFSWPARAMRTTSSWATKCSPSTTASWRAEELGARASAERARRRRRQHGVCTSTQANRRMHGRLSSMWTRHRPRSADHDGHHLGFARARTRAALYVALPGERVDGHALRRRAALRGAAPRARSSPHAARRRPCAPARPPSWGQPSSRCPTPPAAVTDACARMARPSARAASSALTGSTGKTTTKNLVRDVLARRRQRVRHEGQPEQRARRSQHAARRRCRTRQTVVVEMGMRGRRQLAELCDFVRPRLGPCHQRRREPHRASGQPREHRAR